MSIEPRPCAFFNCPNGADPRWGGYCDGHGATTADELTCRMSDENAVLRAEVELMNAENARLRGVLAWVETEVSSNEGDPEAALVSIGHTVRAALKRGAK